MRQLSVRASYSKTMIGRRQAVAFHAAPLQSARFLDDCVATLNDCSPGREPSLLGASNRRFEHARRICQASADARLAAFESTYLSLATVLQPAEIVRQTHPSLELVERTARRLRLFREDTALAREFARIYPLPGWESLDLEGVFEWADRVRRSAYRYLQSGE